MKRIPKFTSIKTQREFWDTHDATEVFGDRGWKTSEAGTTYVNSIYVAKVGPKGALIRIPKEWLAIIGARRGHKIKARVKGKQLLMELA